MRIVGDVPSVVLLEVIPFWLEATIQTNMAIMRRATIPHLYQSGVVYRNEPPGPEEFANVLQVLGLAPRLSGLPGRWGDCDDLICYRIAELRFYEKDTGARVLWRQDAPESKHAQIRRSDGSIEDPCMIVLRNERERTGRSPALS